MKSISSGNKVRHLYPLLFLNAATNIERHLSIVVSETKDNKGLLDESALTYPTDAISLIRFHSV